jgi:hypothetical protein
VASFINNIVTKFTAEGADAVASAADNVNKSQTRLANTSSSAGRQFSAQAQGLGGLVAAYAGAAANIFAITQAYEALNKAARIEQTIEGTKALAAQVGESGSSIIASIKNITNAQLSIAQAAEVANTALSAGFDTKQIAGLADVAFKASRVLGRDLADSIQRVIKGTAKLEPELLDELGIFTRIEPAVDKYATKLGVTAASLTEFQRRQAFANAAIEEGQRKFGVIAISSNSTQASFEKLAATFSDLTQKIGAAIAGTLAPALDFLSKNIGTAFLALGAVGTIVFKNLLGQIGSFVTGTVASLENITNSTKLSTAELKRFSEAAAEAQKAAASTEGKGRFIGAGGVGTAGKEAIERAKAGNVSRTQMAADIPVLKALTESETAYQKKVTESSRSTDAKARAIADSEARMAAATAVAGQYQTALSAAGRGTQILTTLTVGLQTAVRYAAVAIGVLGTALNVIGIIVGAAQLIGTIFDVDILGAVATAWNKLFENSKNLKAGIEGIVGATLNASSDRLRGLFNAKEIEEIAKGAQEKINNALKQTEEQIALQQARVAALNNPSESPSKLYTQGAAKALSKDLGNLDDTAITNLNAEFSSFGITVEKLGGTARVRIKDLKDGLDGLTTIKLLPLIKEQSDLENQLSKADYGSDKYKELLKNLEKTKTAIEIIKKQGDIYGGLTGSLSKVLEVGPDKVYESLRRQNDVVDKTTKAYSINGVEVGKFSKGQLQLNKAQEEYVASAVRAESLTYGVSKALDSGSATSEALSKEVNGSVNALEQLRESTNKQILSGKLSEQQVEAQINAFLKQKAAVDASIKSLEELTAAERITRNIEKQFATERQSFEEGVAKGFINANGQIAKSEAEVTANRLKFLSNTVETGRVAAEALSSNSGLFDTNRSKYQEQVKAGKLAVEAAIGGSFKLVQDAKKINDDLDKRIVTLQNETKELEVQTQLSNVRLNIEKALADAAREEATRQSTLRNVLESNLKNTQARIDSSKTQLSITQSQLEGEQAIADARARAANAGSALAVAKAERQGAAALGPLQLQQQAQQALPNLFTDKQKLDLATNIANIEYANALKVIELKKAQAGAETQQQLTTLSFQQKRLEAEKAQKETEISALQTLQKEQKAIDQSRATSETRKLESEINLKGDREKEIQLNKDLELQKIASTRDSRLQELKLVEERVGLIKQEADVFQAAINGNKDWVNKYIEAVNKQFGGEAITKITIENNFKSVLEDIKKTSDSFQTLKDGINATAKTESSRVEDAAAQRKKILDDNIAQTTTELGQVNARIEADKRRQVGLDADTLARAQADKKLLEDKLSALEIERGAIKTTGATKIEQLSAEADAAKRSNEAALLSIAIQRDTYLRLANEITGIIGNNLNKGVDSFFDAIKNGTLTLKTFKEGVVGVFRDILFDIAKAVTKEIITKPITQAIGSALGGIGEAIFGPATGAAIKKATGAVVEESTKAGASAVSSAAGGGTCGCVTSALEKAVPAAGEAAAKAGENVVAKAGENVVAKAGETVISKAGENAIVKASENAVAKVAETAPSVVTATLPQGAAALTGMSPGARPLPAGDTIASIEQAGVASYPMAPGAWAAMQGRSAKFAGETVGAPATEATTSAFDQNYNGPSFQAPNQMMNNPTGNYVTTGFNGQGNNYQMPGGPAAQPTSPYGTLGPKAELNTEGLQQAVDGTQEKMQGLTNGVDANITKIAESTIAKEGENAVVGAASLAKEVDTAATEASTVAETVDIATKEAGTVADGIDTLAAQESAVVLTSELVPAVGAASSALASLGGGSVVAAAPALLPVGASGGMVGGTSSFARFAAGGGVMMRDSVPSLLEPGEFVMKKSTVDSIGANNLERMNATGRSSAPTNIKVQVDNSGQPKQAEQGETQIDGETAIVKLILKDLNSNGPIRRSIRGNV